MRSAAFALAALLTSAAPALSAVEGLTPDEQAAAVEAAFEQPAAKDWAKKASPSQLTAAKFQLMSWMEENPTEAAKFYHGLAAGTRFDDAKAKAGYDAMVGQYLRFYEQPKSAKTAFAEAGKLSDLLQHEKGLTDEEASELAREVFEGGGTSKVLLSAESEAAVRAVESARPGGARVDAKAFTELRGSAQEKLRAQAASLSADQDAAARFGVAEKLAGYFADRQDALSKARQAYDGLAAVFAKRPEAAAALTPAEAKLLSHSRNELYRWLAASALAKDENLYRRLLAQLQNPLSENLLADLQVSSAARSGYAAKIRALRERLARHVEACAATRRLLDSPGYAADLGRLRLRASADAREALALQREVWRLLEPPQALRRAQKEARAEPSGLWSRAKRWVRDRLEPDNPEAQAARRARADERILREAVEKTAS